MPAWAKALRHSVTAQGKTMPRKLTAMIEDARFTIPTFLCPRSLRSPATAGPSPLEWQVGVRMTTGRGVVKKFVPPNPKFL